MRRSVKLGHARGLLALAATLLLALLAFAGGAAADDDDQDEDRDRGGLNLRAGAVFSMSNALAGNEVVAFARDGDGTLTRVGSFPTGGTGSGGFEDSANGLVLGSSQGESAPNNLIGSSRLLFATNAGSNTVSVFRVLRHGLELVEVQDSGGEKPVSITINRGIAYVLNSGELEDGLVPPNCSILGGASVLPTVTGFTVDADGELTPIPNSTRQLSGDPNSGCAQVSFTPDGKVLVVTERTAKLPGQAPTDEGVINTFVVEGDGTLGRQRVIDATGEGPFGFTFNKNGALLTTEQFDGPAGPGRGAAAGYEVNRDGTLVRTSPSVNNGGTDTCWFVVTDSGKYGFTTSFFGGGRISSYLVDRDGGLRLLDPVAADEEVLDGASDISLSRNSRFLYQLNSFRGTINAFRVGNDGSLTLVQTVQAHAPSPVMAERLGLAAS